MCARGTDDIESWLESRQITEEDEITLCEIFSYNPGEGLRRAWNHSEQIRGGPKAHLSGHFVPGRGPSPGQYASCPADRGKEPLHPACLY